MDGAQRRHPVDTKSGSREQASNRERSSTMDWRAVAILIAIYIILEGQSNDGIDMVILDDSPASTGKITPVIHLVLLAKKP